MIQHVRTVGFKGFDIDEDIPQKVIYTGKNKSGKSARAGAIAIALCGHIPFSTAGKRPGDILDSFGKDSLIAAVTINGTEFARKFSRNAKGSVSQVMQINQKRSSAENFAILLDKAGAPRIADVAEFMKQSEAKKIDTLFDLFPNPELASIDIETENAKEDVSRLEKKKAGAESTVVRLTNSKQNIEIPAGTIAAAQDEIKSVETQIDDFERQIKQAEIEEAEIKAKAEGEQQEKERAEKEAAEKKVDPIETEIQKGEQQIDNFKAGGGFESKPGEIQEPFLPDLSEPYPIDEVIQGSQYTAISARNKIENQTYVKASILRIIEALEGAGCGTCAALIVAKQELKKFKEVS